MRRRRLAACLAACLALLGAGGLVTWSRDARTPGAPHAADAAPEGAVARSKLFAGVLPRVGDGASYAIRWSAEQASDAPWGEGASRSALEGSVDLEARLSLVRVDDRGGWAVLRATLDEVELRTWKILGGDVATSGGEPLASDAELELGHDGELVRIRPGIAASPRASLLIQAVVTQLVLSLPSGGAFAVTERTPAGLALARYDVSDGAPVRVRRRRERFVELPSLRVDVASLEQDVESVTEAEFSRDAFMTYLRTSERVRVESRARAALLLLDNAFSAERAPDGSLGTGRRDARFGEGFAPWEPQVDPAVEKRLLESRVRGLTEGEMHDEIRLVTMLEADTRALGGRARTAVDDGEFNAFFFRATGLLRLHPETSRGLEALFLSEGLGPQGQALVVDLLVSAGTPAAQASLRGVLGAEAARASPHHADLVQRLGHLPRPAPETIAFVFAIYELHAGAGIAPSDAGAEAARRWAARMASTYTLGALLEVLRDGVASPARAPALRAHARLLADLERVREAGDDEAGEIRRAILAALGNASLPQDVAVITPFARAADAATRRQAAVSLRAMRLADARDALHTLVVDPDAPVAEAALDSLAGQPLTDVDAARIAGAVVAGRTSPAVDLVVASLFARRTFPSEIVGSALDVLFARGAPETRRRVAEARERMDTRRR